MPMQSRIGDMNDPEPLHPPTTLTTGSSDTFANSIACAFVTSETSPHTVGKPKEHVSFVEAGSGTVFINSNAAARIGDPIACGQTVASGSPNVFSGD